jgi:hypothetical protein
MHIRSKSLAAFMIILCSAPSFFLKAQASEKESQRKVIEQLLRRHNLQAPKGLPEPRLCSLTGTAIYTKHPQSSIMPETAKKPSMPTRALRKIVHLLATYKSSLNVTQMSRAVVSYKGLVQKIITRR